MKWLKSFAAAFSCVAVALVFVGIIWRLSIEYGPPAFFISTMSVCALIAGTILFHEEKFKYE